MKPTDAENHLPIGNLSVRNSRLALKSLSLLLFASVKIDSLPMAPNSNMNESESMQVYEAGLAALTPRLLRTPIDTPPMPLLLPEP